MRLRSDSFFVVFSLLASLAGAECIPFNEAVKHVGETRCITGHVLRVKQGAHGIHYLDFCEDYRVCSFTVVIFPHDLKNIGDVRRLEGKLVEIHGPVKGYDGRAEIVLAESRQLKGAGVNLPPLPKNYDVENKGRYSAGTFRASKARPKSKKAKPASSASFPDETDLE